MKKMALWGLVPVVIIVAVMLVVTTGPDKPSANQHQVSQTGQVQQNSLPTNTREHQKKAAGNDDDQQKLKDELSHYVALGRGLGEKPASLQGTQVDGHLAADADGNLILDVGIRQVFDYFLSTLGEESLDDIKGRIALYLSEKLPGKAALQAWTLFDHYMSYRHSLSSLPPAKDGSATSMRQAMQARDHLRTSWMGEAASQAFWGPEEAYDNYALKKMQVEQNEALSPAEKQTKLSRLRQTLPAGVKTMLNETMQPTRAVSHVKAMRQKGASEAEVQAYRQKTFGPEAAARFKHLDEKRANWEKHYGEYRKQRQQIVDAGLDKKDQAQQIKALRKRMFSASQQRRAAALDRISAHKAQAAPEKQQKKQD